MFSKEKQVKTYLLSWYKKNRRSLPWRKKNSNGLLNPYYVFVSEYMLQQTTVNTVKIRFRQFIKRWPTLKVLAKASEPQILEFWSGLGYYSRARNLLKAIKIINKNFNNKIPNNYDELIILPGVGDYTAKAILGIAYNQPIMPTDANIERILVRLFAIQKPITKIKNELKGLAEKFISRKYSSDLIQSFMDFGSIVCVPRNPKCEDCNINNICESNKKNISNILPMKIKRESTKPIKYTRAYVLINENNEILVRNRPSKGMLASMLEVPNDNWVKDKKSLLSDQSINHLKTKLFHKGSFEYSFSHFDLEADIYYGKIKKSEITSSKWIKKKNYTKSGLPTVMKKIVEIAI